VKVVNEEIDLVQVAMVLKKKNPLAGLGISSQG
jgi:hypothetical protein